MSANYKFDPEKVNYFAYVDKRDKKVAFGIKAKDRLQHIYVIGKTGTGKSTLLENMAIQDIINDEGVCFIDPHGNSASRILEYVPKHRIDDVLYFAPFDIDFPVAFNILEDVGYEKRHLAADSIMSVFKHIWKDAWSSRMEYILQNTLLALLEYPNTTLLDINRMLINTEFRREVVLSVSDPIVKRFWMEEFAGYSDRYAQEATPAIQNKIGQFISNPLVRNIVGQSKSSFDLQEFMEERKILIVNLSKGQLGEQNTALLGSLITAKIYLEAMARATQDISDRPPFYVYVDEFQNVVNSSFESMLSEARKYRVPLVLAHQYIDQLDAHTRASVFGNVGTTIVFNVGPQDAEILEPIFTPSFKAQELNSLAVQEIALSLLIDGEAAQPFLAKTLPPIEHPPYNFKNQILEASRRQYVRSRRGVEEFIAEIDRKRGSANIQKLNHNARQYTASTNNKKGDVSTDDVMNMNAQKQLKKNTNISPADILRKKRDEEPDGFKGPQDIKKQKIDSVKNNDGLRDVLNEVLKFNQENKKADAAKKDPLQDIKQDANARRDNVIERTMKILNKLSPKKTSVNASGTMLANSSDKHEQTASTVSGMQLEDSEEQEIATHKMLAATAKNNTESEMFIEEMVDKNNLVEEENFANDDETENKSKISSDPHLIDKLEDTLKNANTMSDDELRETLEALLYEEK